MGTHATREEEIDELLRGEVFVDLLQVVRQGLRAGVESYSLKEIEQLFFTRDGRGRLGQRGGDRVRALARRPRPGAARRDRGLQRGGLPRDARAARLAARPTARGGARARRRDPVPAAARGRGAEPSATRRRPRPRGSATRCSPARSRATAASSARRLLEYHRREARPGWWWYFRRLRDDRRGARRRRRGARLARARRHGAGRPVARIRAKSLEWTFTLPAAAAPVRRGRRRRGSARGRDRLDGRRRSTTPTARISSAPRQGEARRAAADVARPGRAVPHEGAAGGAPPARRVAPRRRRPLPASRAAAPARAAARRRAACSAASSTSSARCSTGSTGSYLVVQGPPGSGKTYRGARLITHLLAQGRKVGIIAQSHKVIHNLLDEIERGGGRGGARLQGDQARRPLRERAREARATSIATCSTRR